MRRILVIGNPGAGKTALSRELGHILSLPVIHLDREFWLPGWIERERDDWRRIVAELAAGDEWIIDGNYHSSNDIRFPRADSIIFLDFPTRTCLTRILKRVATSFGRVRPDMADGCPEKIDLEFIKWVWRFRRDIRPSILEDLDTYFADPGPIILKNRRQVHDFVARIGDRDRSTGE